MNETNNDRKVLISVKVSTLLIILLAIIVVIVIAVVVSNGFTKDEQGSSTNISTTQDDGDEESLDDDLYNSVVEEEESSTTKLIQANVTSRSLEESRISEEVTVIGNEEETVEEIEEPEVVEEVITTTPIEEVTISKDMDLTVRTGLSRDDFITLIANVEQDTSGFFEENAGLIYDLCETYQINEIFFCGLISAESGWTIASAHRTAHNYISLMSSSGLIKYESVEVGLEKAAQTLHDKYLTEGGCFYYGKTLAAVKTKFCPASSTWVNLVYQRMEQILN